MQLKAFERKQWHQTPYMQTVGSWIKTAIECLRTARQIVLKAALIGELRDKPAPAQFMHEILWFHIHLKSVSTFFRNYRQHIDNIRGIHMSSMSLLKPKRAIKSDRTIAE